MARTEGTVWVPLETLLSVSLISPMVSVDVKQHCKEKAMGIICTLHFLACQR